MTKRQIRFIIGTIIAAVVLVGGIVIAIHATHKSATGSSTKYLVSLGDSMAAGAGLPAETNSGPYVSCARSKQAFPVLLADTLGTTLKQFACSGATIDNGINESQFTDVPAQLTAAKPFLAGNDVVINIGINDINGLVLVAQCARATDCVSAEQQSALDTSLTKLQSNLSQLLSTIQSAKPKKVVVNTYYTLLASGDTCFASYGFTSTKVDQINQLEKSLNQVITDTATEGGAKAIAVDFSGHTLCAGTPWIQGLLDKAPLHPTAAGQKQIASQDAAAFQ